MSEGIRIGLLIDFYKIPIKIFEGDILSLWFRGNMPSIRIHISRLSSIASSVWRRLKLWVSRGFPSSRHTQHEEGDNGKSYRRPLIIRERIDDMARMLWPNRSGNSIEADFPALFSDALPQIDKIQIGGLRCIFARLNVEYVPQFAIDTIGELRQDVVSGFLIFLKKIKVDPTSLFYRGSEIQKSKLDDAVGILLQVDMIRCDVDVNPVPIYKALGESTTKAQDFLERMYLVRDVLKRIRTGSAPIFFDYQRWINQVQDQLEHWDKYGLDELKGVIYYSQKWEDLQSDFELTNGSINEIITKLSECSSWDRIRSAVEEKLSEIEKITAALFNGITKPIATSEEDSLLKAGPLVGYLKIILEELESIFRDIFEDELNPLDAQIMEACTILEIKLDPLEKDIQNVLQKTGEKTIRDAYIKAVKKYHPDRSPKYPESEKMIRLINLAYELLRKILKKG